MNLHFAELNAGDLALLHIVGETKRKELQLLLHFARGRGPSGASRNRSTRSGVSISALRALLPTVTVGRPPSLGTGQEPQPRERDCEPSTPGITTGLSPSMYATREFVVPRSIPTTRPSAILFVHAPRVSFTSRTQVAQVAPAVEQGNHLVLRSLSRTASSPWSQVVHSARRSLVDAFPACPQISALPAVRLASDLGIFFVHRLAAMRISSICMFRSNTSSSRSAGAREGSSPRPCRRCSSPISAP